MSARWACPETADRHVLHGASGFAFQALVQISKTPPSITPRTPSAPRKALRSRLRRVALQPRRLTYNDESQNSEHSQQQQQQQQDCREPLPQRVRSESGDGAPTVASRVDSSLGQLTRSFLHADTEKENRPENFHAPDSVSKGHARRLRLRASSRPAYLASRRTTAALSSSASSNLSKPACRSFRL